MVCRELDWDSRFFGRRIAEVSESRLDAERLRAVERWCDEHAIDCLYLLADFDPGTIALAEGSGFALKDVRMTFRRALAAPMAPVDTKFLVRPARSDDLPSLEAIAARSHTDSRFYADPGFGRAKDDELYRVWIRNSVGGWADDVLVLAGGSDGRALGYITGHRRGSEGRIGLVAVAEEARGAGGASLLVTALCGRHREAGLDAMAVVTQGRNLAAQRLYQRLGFVSHALGLWYHRWWAR